MRFMINFLFGLPVPLLLTLAVTGVVAGDFFAKYWSVHRQPHLFLLALLGYLASGLFYTPTLLKKGLVVTSITWTVASLIGFLIIGIVIFGEHLSAWQVVGVAFGVMSLLILAF